MIGPRTPLAMIAVAVLGFTARPAAAHPLTPASLSLQSTSESTYEVTFRRPERAANVLALELPPGCERGAGQSAPSGDQRVDHFTLRCARSLEGTVLGVRGLAPLGLSAVVSIALPGGEQVRTLLTPERTSYTIPARTPALALLGDALRLGVHHLWTGFDHVLFIAGLLLLVRGLRARALALSAFTLGHSLTLCLAVLTRAALPEGPVELGIALSLVVLAYEVLSPRTTPRLLPLAAMACGFGLLHGLGFAGALADLALPRHALALSLFGFNLGVELGQLSVVLALAALAPLAARVRLLSHERLRTLGAYAIGSLAAMWCIERTLALL